jgi:hypothetical protein
MSKQTKRGAMAQRSSLNVMASCWSASATATTINATNAVGLIEIIVEESGWSPPEKPKRLKTAKYGSKSDTFRNRSNKIVLLL